MLSVIVAGRTGLFGARAGCERQDRACTQPQKALTAAAATDAGLIVLGQVRATGTWQDIALVVAGVTAHRAGPGHEGKTTPCWAELRARWRTPGPWLRPAPAPPGSRSARLGRRRIRGYQIRARVGDTRITCG